MTDHAKLETAARSWIALFDNDTYGTMHLSEVPEAVDLRAALEAEPARDGFDRPDLPPGFLRDMKAIAEKYPGVSV